MKTQDVLRLLQISRITLCKYVKKGIIEVKVLPSGRYDYVDSSVLKCAGIDEEDRKNVVYARVSSKGQKSNLDNQIKTVKEYANSNGYKIDCVYSDIASGLSHDRDEFNNLLQDVITYKIKKVFILSKDRLSRASFKIWKELFSKFYCDIIVLNDDNKDDDSDKELFEDIISLLDYFSNKMYSRRRKRKLELVSEDLNMVD